MALLPWMRARAGFVQVRLPEWLYDLLVYVFFPMNWLLAAVASRFPCAYTAVDWPLDPARKPGALRAPRAGTREAIRARSTQRLDDEELWSLFDSLPAPSANEMMGNWRGKIVRTGGWLDAAFFMENPADWLGVEWGKRFFSPYQGDPLIFIVRKRLIVPVPAWGNVSMPEISLRGKSGATMTYDHQPWKDHFRVLDDGKASGQRMMLGNWMSREKNGGWFTLEEHADSTAAIADQLIRSPY